MDKQKLKRAIKETRAWVLGVATVICFALATSNDPFKVLLVQLMVQIPVYSILLFIVYKTIK